MKDRSAPLFRAKLAVARGIGRLSRASRRGGGTTLPGRVLLSLDEQALARLGARLGGGVTLISATNGKTTTAGLIASMLTAASREPVHNRAGSNMAWGIATALAEQSGDEGLFEVDEAWLTRVATDLGPTLLVLSNLFRDQLDRYGELEQIADAWAALVDRLEGGCELALAADDPLVADLGRDRQLRRREGVTYFGIEDPSVALPELQHAFDAKHCRRCGAPYEYERSFVGHLGHYRCTSCGAGRPEPDVKATRIQLRGFEGSVVDVATPAGETRMKLGLPGLYNVYNALAAVAAALRLGLSLEQIAAGAGSATAAFGRVEAIGLGERRAWLLLVKNPAGANEVVRTLAQQSALIGRPLDVWIALNDGIADGRDVSWIWDADFELLEPCARRFTCAGARGAEMAVRLKYAGIDEALIEVDEGDLASSFEAAASRSEGDLYALPTYTALVDLRTSLARRGLAQEYWR